MFGQSRELLDSPINHALHTVRQMIPVAPMGGHTLNASPVELACGRASAVVYSRPFDLRKEFVLQLACLLGLALLEQFHCLDFHGVVIDGHR